MIKGPSALTQQLLSVSFAAGNSVSLISMGAMGSDWLMAAGQSKLLRPALHLAINALSFSLSISQSLVFFTSSLPSTLCPFRKRVNRKRHHCSTQGRGKKNNREGNNTETNEFCSDGRKKRNKWQE